MKFIFSAQGQMTDEFPVGGDFSSKPGARFRVLHPDLAGSTLKVEQYMSDDTWVTIFVIDENVDGLGSIIDSVHGGVYRIRCSTYGGSAVTVYYKE